MVERKNVDFIYNMACNMGGMGFIENNKAECMLSVLVNTNLLRSCLVNKVKKYFFSSSAFAYNTDLQKDPNIQGLKEEDACTLLRSPLLALLYRCPFQKKNQQ